MADLLSEKRVVGSRVMSKTCEIKKRSQMASLVACIIATYSALVVDRMMISCHLALHETAPP